MRVAVLTTGSRGDVQPILALSRGMLRAGHDVLVATHERFRPFVESEGLAFRALAGDPLEMLESPTGQAWVRSGRNSFAFMLNYIRLTRPILPALLRDSQRAVEGADLIVFTVFAPAGLHLSEALGVPAAMAALQPFHATGEFPAMGVMGPVRLPWMNRTSHRVTDLLLWLPFRDLVNRWRVGQLGLRPWSVRPPLARMDARQIPTLYGYSPSVIRRPDDWGPWVHVTGYWFLDHEPGWRPPTPVQRFLEAGDPPIYVGFGSMVSGEGGRLEAALAYAVGKLDRRIVLQRGWEGISDPSLGDQVLTIGSIPHDWLFPRMAAVVHHGGAGTTGAGLRAGVPNVLVPHFADQFLWADRVRSLGAGPAPIPLQDLDGPRLVESLQQALSSGSIRSRAAAIGASIRAERGVQSAVEILTRLR